MRAFENLYRYELLFENFSDLHHNAVKASIHDGLMDRLVSARLPEPERMSAAGISYREVLTEQSTFTPGTLYIRLKKSKSSYRPGKIFKNYRNVQNNPPEPDI